jgi:hypothetical protein
MINSILLSYSLNTRYFKCYNTSSLYSSKGRILLTNLSLNFMETISIFTLVLLTNSKWRYIYIYIYIYIHRILLRLEYLESSTKRTPFSCKKFPRNGEANYNITFGWLKLDGRKRVYKGDMFENLTYCFSSFHLKTLLRKWLHFATPNEKKPLVFTFHSYWLLPYYFTFLFILLISWSTIYN